MDLGGFLIVLYQTENGIPSRHQAAKECTVHTTTLEFGDIPSSKRVRAENIANDIARLLTFATMSPVRPCLYEYGDSTRHETVNAKTLIFRPTIEVLDGRAVRLFLQGTWSSFRHFKRPRKLAAIFDYLVIAEHPELPIEASTLLLFTALESLKSTHSPGKKGDFEPRIKRMLQDVGMRRGLERLRKRRNTLVHEGLVRIPPRTLWGYRNRLHDIMREYLLRLLGYKGEYFIYSKCSRAMRHL